MTQMLAMQKMHITRHIYLEHIHSSFISHMVSDRTTAVNDHQGISNSHLKEQIKHCKTTVKKKKR